MAPAAKGSPGSEGSKGSARLQRAGSEGCGAAPFGAVFLWECGTMPSAHSPTALAGWQRNWIRREPIGERESSDMLSRGGRWWRQPPKGGPPERYRAIDSLPRRPSTFYLLSSTFYLLSSIQKTPLINERRFLIVRGRQPCEGGGFSSYQCLRFRCSPPGRSGGRGCRGSRRCCGFRGFSLRVYPVLFP